MKQQIISLCIQVLGLFFIIVSHAHAQWQSQYYRDHPLVGKIFSTEAQQWITQTQLMQTLHEKQFVLLGETHTNPDHHIGQAQLIEQLISKSNSVVLVFEMLSYDEWSGFRLPGLEVNELTDKLKQTAGRWDWDIYNPILQLQVEHQLPMVGANLTRAQLDKYSSGELCEVARNNLILNACNVLNEQQQQAIKQLIFDAHCEYLPMANTQPMMQVQAAKDASFALSMADEQAQQVVLIAGAVHVRKDIGVPVHLQELGYDVDKSTVSLAFINVQPDKNHVSDYFGSSDAAQQFDYLLFTPSERNQDPCVEFAEQLKKMKQSKTKH